MPRVGFEATIPVLELAKMFHALDRAATVLGSNQLKKKNLVMMDGHLTQV
jgi:hypothetical protein